MGAVCISFSWRGILLMLMILATFTFTVQCSQSSAALFSKAYPRGNHWAVGHLMGRKSVEMLPAPPVDDQHSPHHLTSLERRDATLEQQHPSKLDRALFGSSPDSQRQTPYGPDRRFLEKTDGMEGRGREEVRFKPLREMPDLLLLGLNLKNGGSR